MREEVESQFEGNINTQKRNKKMDRISGNTIYLNLWNAIEAVLREIFIAQILQKNT